eukprot:5336295-Prymnesium_polylepis.1
MVCVNDRGAAARGLPPVLALSAACSGIWESGELYINKVLGGIFGGGIKPYSCSVQLQGTDEWNPLALPPEPSVPKTVTVTKGKLGLVRPF